MSGLPATVTEGGDGILKVLETGPPLADKEVTDDESFYQHLMEYGSGWFWDNLIISEGVKWIPEAIQGGTLTCVTDGLYIKHMAPKISGAG